MSWWTVDLVCVGWWGTDGELDEDLEDLLRSEDRGLAEVGSWISVLGNELCVVVLVRIELY